MNLVPILIAAIALAGAHPAAAWELDQAASGAALTCNFTTEGAIPSECAACLPK